jgi:hypothetical protein
MVRAAVYNFMSIFVTVLITVTFVGVTVTLGWRDSLIVYAIGLPIALALFTFPQSGKYLRDPQCYLLAATWPIWLYSGLRTRGESLSQHIAGYSPKGH